MDGSSKGCALVTGASSGIGEAFARRLAAEGYDLIVVARRLELLEKLARELSGTHRVAVEVETADLSVEDNVARLAERIRGTETLAMLVNNAGFGSAERFINADLESQLRMAYVHNIATLWLTHAAVQGMIARGGGSIINVSSIGGLLPAPFNATYNATKGFLVLFSESLQQELRGTGVKVQALCPGFIHTGFHAAIGVERNVPERFWLSSEVVVDASLDDLARGRVVCIPGRMQRLIMSFMLSLPRSLRYRLTTLVEG